MKPQCTIMRFTEYKRSEIGRIEAHDERAKETCENHKHDDSEAITLIEKIPPEILERYRHPSRRKKEAQHAAEH